MIRALPPAPARRGKNKGKGVGVGGPWPGERKSVGTGDSDGPRLRLRRTCRPVKISRRADDDDGARQAPHRTCVPARRPPSAAGDGRMVQVGGSGAESVAVREGRRGHAFLFPLSRATRMVGEWVVAAVSGTRSPPGRSLTTPPPSRPLERVVRGSPGSCLRRPAVSAWRAASLAPREILTGFDGAARTPQPLTDSVVPRIISGKSGACHV